MSHGAARSNPRREFIRHTADVPLEIRALEGAEIQAETRDVSFGGLAFSTAVCPDAGDVIELRIPTVDPPFEARARITWCRPDADGFLVGVEFLDAADAFRARMVQQVCSIERYRREVEENDGRQMDAQQAAAEWIGRYAGRFPDADLAHPEPDGDPSPWER